MSAGIVTTAQKTFAMNAIATRSVVVVMKQRTIGKNWSMKKMTENKMEQVAAMFGKKLGEHFYVNCSNTRFLLKFTFDGLWVFDDSWGHWNGEDGMLEALLRGEAVVVDG